MDKSKAKLARSWGQYQLKLEKDDGISTFIT